MPLPNSYYIAAAVYRSRTGKVSTQSTTPTNESKKEEENDSDHVFQKSNLSGVICFGCMHTQAYILQTGLSCKELRDKFLRRGKYKKLDK